MPKKNQSRIVLDADEMAILTFLGNWPDSFIAEREIARRAAGRSRFSESPDWTCLALPRLVELNLIEADEKGHYRIKAIQAKKCLNPPRHVSPKVQQVLETAGYCPHCLQKHSAS